MGRTSICLLTLLLSVQIILAVSPYFYEPQAAQVGGVDSPAENEVGGDLAVDRLIQGLSKRSCIRRGGRCDHRPDDCCSGGACRCNLWGTNCQCQRMGIFQKWG